MNVCTKFDGNLVVVEIFHAHIQLKVPFGGIVNKSCIFLSFFLIKDWLQISKGMKESFNPNYNERACPVREYCPVSQSNRESFDSSTSSVTTDQTDCSVLIPADESGLSTSCSSSTSTVLVSSEEAEQVSV